MAPRIFVEAPRCPRCNDRVYAAEQVLGPMAKPYHKQCLKCVVCNKLLDSVSLLEHEGEPFCNNCHRTHLGQGKDKFGTAVPLRPKVDVTPKKSEGSSQPSTPSRLARATPDAATPSPSRRPLPTTPSGSANPLSLPKSLSRQSLGERSMEATQSELSFEAPTIASPSAPIISGTPLCARCQKPVCTCRN